MDGTILEGQARGNKISIALGLGTVHQYRLFRRSQAESQDTVDIDRRDICGANAKILDQQPCAYWMSIEGLRKNSVLLA